MNCNLCNTIKTTNVAITGGNLVLTVSPFTFTNLEKYNIVICQNIPANAGSLPVVVNNRSIIPMITRKGNVFLGKYLKCRSVLKLWYSNNPILFTSVNFVNVCDCDCNCNTVFGLNILSNNEISNNETKLKSNINLKKNTTDEV